jgi:two-component system chemotaxis response regulator CheB
LEVVRSDIIVVGASAGGVTALTKLVAGLPSSLQASLFVVLHLAPWQPSNLPEILSGSGPLPAFHPKAGQKIEPGKIYVASPDLHLVIEDGCVRSWRGPKENGHRPSINPLFRSAAVAYGPRVTGVILSGYLDDGSAGLWWVKRYGGVAVVQDPKEARFPEMPMAAMDYVKVDYVVGIEGMAALLTALANGELEAPQPPSTRKETGEWKQK